MRRYGRLEGALGYGRSFNAEHSCDVEDRTVGEHSKDVGAGSMSGAASSRPCPFGVCEPLETRAIGMGDDVARYDFQRCTDGFMSVVFVNKLTTRPGNDDKNRKCSGSR